ncbi:hypothetical protein DEIPH_ctg026orf0048 [Deinococcus phoenicis]|uniref:O-antigen ligase-related domain-containing protein n=1 Tax=Deinococcus phoenicis TaxID=1476583 RepID=A0A016QPT7_9DEIO|nr:O-antigen ligase family protein [Deinococcus phoenicis]EYB68145.1 hypothetical protein DEIPH_ctg026orf0048 [Deinococcus phoenicis]
MTALYGSVLAGALAGYAVVAARSLRTALLIGLAFSIFSLPALPLFLLPVSGPGVALRLLFIGLAVLYFVLRPHKDRAFASLINPYTFGIALFAAVMLAFLMFTPSPEYGASKTRLFLLQSALPIAAFALLGPFDQRDLRSLLHTLIVGGVLGGLSLVLFGHTSTAGAVDRAVLGDASDPISISRAVGFGLTALLVRLLLMPGVRLGQAALLFGGALLMGWAMIATGSRGPLLSVVSTVLVTFVVARGSLGGKVKALAHLLALVAAVTLLVQSAGPQRLGVGYERLNEQFNSLGDNSSDQGRLYRYQLAVQGYEATRGAGVGTGGFAALMPPANQREFPHNIVLEVAVELGDTGLAVLLGLVGYLLVLVLTRQRAGVPLVQPFIALWLFSFFNAWVSGDVASNSAFWISGYLLWASLSGTPRNTAQGAL